MAHKLDCKPDKRLQTVAAGLNHTKVHDDVKVKSETETPQTPETPYDAHHLHLQAQARALSQSSLSDHAEFTNPILNHDCDDDKRRYRQVIGQMKYIRWWDDIEESYAAFETLFCVEIEYNIKSVRSKHFPMTKLIRHYEIDTAVSAFVRNGAASASASVSASASKRQVEVGVYIGYTSQGPFSRMFDETVTSPERKNRQGSFRTVRRFILGLQAVPSDLRASFSEKALVQKYLGTYGNTVINCPTAATYDRQDGWVYLTFHERVISDTAGAANATEGAAPVTSASQTQLSRSAFAQDAALFAPEVERAFTRTDDYYTCNYCKKPYHYKATKSGLSLTARRHYINCPDRVITGQR